MKRRLAGEEAIECRPEAVDIAAGIDQVLLSIRLLGARIGRRPLELPLDRRLRPLPDVCGRDDLFR